MKQSFAAALCLLLFLGTVPSASGRTFYVAVNGSDNAPGTIGLPWRTLTYAGNQLTAGDTLYVRGGVYHQDLVTSRSGSPGAYIVYSAYPGEFVQIDGLLDGSHEVVTVWQKYIVIQGFTFRDQDYLHAPWATSYWVNLNGENIIFRRNRVIADGNAFQNIYTANEKSRGVVVGGKSITVENCFVRGMYYGIVLAGPSPRYDILRYDTVYTTGASNIVVTSTLGSSTALHSTLIEYCVLDTSFEEDNIQFENDYTHALETVYNRGTIVRYNRCGNAAENAIDLKGTERIVIDHNFLYSASGDDNGVIDGHDKGSGTGLVTKSPGVGTRLTLVRYNVINDNLSGAVMTEGDIYYNNTILNNRRTWEGPNQLDNGVFGIIAWSEAGADRILINNIIGGQPNRAMLEWTMDGSNGGFYMNNNLYYDGVGPAKFLHRVSGNYTTTESVQSWKSILSSYGGYTFMGGKDANSLEADPQFVNATMFPVGYDPSRDFGLRPTSPAVDAGRAVVAAQNVGVNSQTLVVGNAGAFCDGFGITQGDFIKIGYSDPVYISTIDYATNVITLQSPRTWSIGDGVHLAYVGSAPDIGAFEFTLDVNKTGGPSVPQLMVLADGSTGVSLTPSLQWSSVATATGYQVQVAASVDFGSPFLDVTTTGSTSVAVSGLAYGKTYYWHVRASNASGTSSWSSAYSFTTLPDPAAGTAPSEAVANGTFSNGIDPWVFFTNGTATCTPVTLSGSSVKAARVDIVQSGNNTQLHQANLVIDGDTYYDLTFSAYSTSGHDIEVSLLKNVSPYNSYGLMLEKCDLGTSWKRYTLHFKTENISGLANNGRLMFWFSNCAAAGDTYWIDSVSLVKALAPTEKAQFVFPAPGSIDQPGLVRLTWNSVPLAETYQVQMSTDSLFAIPAMERTVCDTFTVVGPLESGKTYYRRVRAINSYGSTSYCGACYFRTRVPSTVPLIPTIVSTPGLLVLGTTSKSLSWSRTREADWYEVQIATDANFLAMAAQLMVTDTMTSVLSLQGGQKYSVRVRAGNSVGNSLYSFPSTFTASSSTGIEPDIAVPRSFHLEQNYPNPFNPTTVVRYALPVRTRVSMIVYNLLGQKVATLVEGEESQGVHEVVFKAEGLASGIYLCALRTPAYLETRKMVLAR